MAGCKIACKGRLLLYPTQGGYLTYLASPIIIQLLKKNFQKYLFYYYTEEGTKLKYFTL